jgi:hypothetical protein
MCCICAPESFRECSFVYIVLRVSTASCAGPEVDATVSQRIVELLQASFCKGNIDIAEHLKFLFTLLAARMPSQGKSTSFWIYLKLLTSLVSSL